MSFCPGVNTNEFFEQTDDGLETTTIKPGSTPQRYTPGRMARAYGNLLTGYFSDQASCNWIPGALPGGWETPYVWRSTCNGVGVKRQLTLIDLFGNACGPNAENFCNSITDQGGNKRSPMACGGSDPNLFTYNPTQTALTEAAPALQALQDAADEAADEIISSNRKKIVSIGLILILLGVLVYIILR